VAESSRHDSYPKDDTFRCGIQETKELLEAIQLAIDFMEKEPKD